MNQIPTLKQSVMVFNHSQHSLKMDLMISQLSESKTGMAELQIFSLLSQKQKLKSQELCVVNLKTPLMFNESGTRLIVLKQ
jgi:hypothetical protein